MCFSGIGSPTTNDEHTTEEGGGDLRIFFMRPVRELDPSAPRRSMHFDPFLLTLLLPPLPPLPLPFLAGTGAAVFFLERRGGIGRSVGRGTLSSVSGRLRSSEELVEAE